MRRGLMAWSEADLPRAVLEQRLSRLQAGMERAGLGGVVLYTNVARPAAVSFLTGFTPYWSEGLLLVPVSGEPILAIALSRRVSGWIRTVMPVGAIETTPQPAAAIGRRLAGMRRLGIVELDMFPAAQADRLTASADAVSFEDATALFRSVRLRVDGAEIALVRRADGLARRCLQTFERSDDARAVVADIEARARLAGAEEVFVAVAPDLRRATAFLRSDRLDALGEHFAVRLSLALKGSWTRRTATVSRLSKAPAAFAVADAVFERALKSPSPAAALKALQDGLPGRMNSWTVEACVASYPLEVVAASSDDRPFSAMLPVSVVSVKAECDGITWFGAGPVIAGS